MHNDSRQLTYNYDFMNAKFYIYRESNQIMIITTKINKHVNNTSNFLYLCRKLKIIYTKWIVVLTIKGAELFREY